MWAYDLQANTWSEKGVAPAGATPWAYDPRSGLVVAARYDTPADLWNYDVETDAWIPIRQTSASDSNPPYVAYDVSVDRIIVPEAETWLVDLRTGTWSDSGAETPLVIAGYGMQAAAIEYDEAAERTVVFGNDRLALYDATANRWEILGAAALGRPDSLPVSMVYDPVNRRLVGWRWLAMAEIPADVIAFDLVTRDWTVLLEPGKGQSHAVAAAGRQLRHHSASRGGRCRECAHER